MTQSVSRVHVRALDGIRGLAIGLVLLYHGFTFDPYGTGIGHYIDRFRLIGWAGVDVFFVMSGFLITGILVETRERPRYWRDFMIRRGLRIFPLYYVVLVAILVGSIAVPDLAKGTTATIWVNALYITNFWIAAYGENHVPLDSAWSLAIEEQFYILYPWIVRYVKPRALVAFLICLVVAAPVLRLITFNYGAQPQLGPYVLPYCRMDCLAIGSLVRLAFDGGKQAGLRAFGWYAPLLGVAGFAVLLTWPRGAVITDVRYTVFGYTITAVAAASLLARVVVASPGHWLRRAFEWRPLVYVGKLSYCIYLIHLISRVAVAKLLSLVVSRHQHELAYCTAQLVGMVALSIGVASLSYHYFELPILGLKERWAPSRAQQARQDYVEPGR